MKILLLFIFFTASLFAISINESLLKIHATLVPKIYLMDYKFQDKLKDNTISIAIVYKKNEYKDAKKLKTMMENRYQDGIKTYSVNAFLVDYNDLKSTDANIYYLFPAEEEKVQAVIKRANINKALTFSYLKDDLKYGVMISLNISKKIRPLLNLEAIRNHNISLRPMLINISNIYLINLKSKQKLLKIKGFNSNLVFQV